MYREFILDNKFTTQLKNMILFIPLGYWANVDPGFTIQWPSASHFRSTDSENKQENTQSLQFWIKSLYAAWKFHWFEVEFIYFYIVAFFKNNRFKETKAMQLFINIENYSRLWEYCKNVSRLRALYVMCLYVYREQCNFIVYTFSRMKYESVLIKNFFLHKTKLYLPEPSKEY